MTHVNLALALCDGDAHDGQLGRTTRGLGISSTNPNLRGRRGYRIQALSRDASYILNLHDPANPFYGCPGFEHGHPREEHCKHIWLPRMAASY